MRLSRPLWAGSRHQPMQFSIPYDHRQHRANGVCARPQSGAAGGLQSTFDFCGGVWGDRGLNGRIN
jgi:hypothetical protein